MIPTLPLALPLLSFLLTPVPTLAPQVVTGSSALGPRVAVQPARLWTVSSVPGQGDFATIQDAVDASTSGDAILVLAGGIGPYPGFTIAGKGTSVFGEASFTLDGPVLVRDVPAGASVVLRGFTMQIFTGSGASLSSPMLEVRNCGGPVWIEDCGIWYDVEGAPFVVEDAESVILARCNAISASQGPLAHATLTAERSSVFAYATDFRGENNTTYQLPAGSAASIVDSYFYAAGCSFVGGSLFGQAQLGFSAPGSGLFANAGSEVQALDCFFAAGGGGILTAEDFVGPVTQLPGDARDLSVDPIARSGAPLTISGQAEFFDRLELIRATAAQVGVYLQQHLGIQLVAPPYDFEDLGTLPPTTFYSRTATTPPLHPLRPFQVFYYQGLFFDRDGFAFLSSPSATLRIP